MPFTGDAFNLDMEGAYVHGGPSTSQPKIHNARIAAEFSGVATGLSAVAGRVTDLGGTGAVDNAALRADGTTSPKIQASPLVIADTTGGLSRNGGGGIPLQGTNTDDDASAGQVGEYDTAALASGSAVSLTSTVAADIISDSLEPGDYDVWAVGVFTGNAATTVTNLISSISLTSNTLDTTVGRYGANIYNGATVFAGGDPTVVVVPTRVKIPSGSPQTVYLVGRTVHGVSTASGYGSLFWRRRR